MAMNDIKIPSKKPTLKRLEKSNKLVLKSNKLSNVCYDIRGPVLQRARQMEDEGQRIIKLNIGNPASFGSESHVDMDYEGFCLSRRL